MLRRLLTRLYAHLLKLYPDRFLDEFGGEMGDVFAQALSGLDDSDALPAARRLKMARLFFREVWYFPRAYLDARRYHVKSGADDTPLGSTSFGEQDTTETWMGRRASWGEALIGALPFLLYGLVFDTVLLATEAVASLRSRTSWGRVLSLEAAVLILVVKGILMGWIGELEGALDWPMLLFIIIIYFGLLMLPGVIGLLRRGVGVLSSR